MRSVLAQTHRKLELIVSDDASDDDSCAIVENLAARDPRIRLIEAQFQGGPARVRNLALAAARGEWIAIVDSDDLLEPDRLSAMLEAADALNANIVADDMVPFGDVAGATETMFGDTLTSGQRIISAIDMITSEWPDSPQTPLGYLKPVIHRTALGALRYDETLRNGEDFDLYLRLLLGGARFALIPQASYHYRRHSAAISHRLSVDVLKPLLEAHDRLVRQQSDAPPKIAKLLRKRRVRLVRSLRYARLVRAIKSGNARQALLLLGKHPVLVSDLVESLRDRRKRSQARLRQSSGESSSR